MPPLTGRGLIPLLVLAAVCWGAIGCAEPPIHCGSGEAIAFSEITKRAFGDSVSLVCPDGSHYRPLLKPKESQSYLFVDGLSFSRALLVTVLDQVPPGGTETISLFSFDARTGLLLMVPGLLGQPGRGALSPDGSLIAYESTGDPSAPLRLVVKDTQTGQNFLIPTAPNTTDNLPTWSPDGKELMFIRLGYAPGSSIPLSATLMRIPFPPGQPTAVFGPEEEITSAAYSADGRRFAIASQNGLEIVDRTTLSRTVILETSAIAPRIPGTAGLIWGGLSKTLAFTLHNTQTSASELWTVHEDGKDARQVYSVRDGTLYVGSYLIQ